MSVPCLTIADAVVTALNAADLSQSFTATRTYVPKFDLQSDSTLQVQVVPKTDTREAETRSTDAADIPIDIGVMKKLQTVANEIAEIDAMLELCEEIKHVLNRQRLNGVTWAACVKLQQDPIYSVQEVDELRTFLTVITATFRASVAI